MSRSSITRRVAVAAATVAAAAVAFPLAHAGAAAQPKTTNCSMSVIGQADDGELVTTAMSCSAGPIAMAAASYPIAVHYKDPNFGGSTLTIYGDGCTGGWLNMPTGWNDVISSTISSCIVDHYDGYFMLGNVQTLSYGNLSYPLDNKTGSARYR